VCVCVRYLCPASVDSCDAATGKERFDAVIRCFEVIGFTPQVRFIHDLTVQLRRNNIYSFIVTKGIFDYTNLDSDSVNVLGMHTCKHVHDKLSCTLYGLQNYTMVYTNMAAVTKFIAKNNKTITLASKTM